MKNFFKQLFCHHDWTEWETGYGDNYDSERKRMVRTYYETRRCRNCNKVAYHWERTIDV